MATDTDGTVEVELIGLSDDEVMELIAGGRAKNAYAPKVEQFAKSQEKGIEPAKVWPVEFTGKQPTTLMQGFNAAVRKLGLEDQIQVIKRGERVVLINKAMLNGAAPAEESK